MPVDRATPLFLAASFAIALVGLVLVIRAFSAPAWSARLTWLARGLALFGAAVAVAFPAILYGEIAVVLPRDPGLVPAIAKEIEVDLIEKPFVLVPVLVALRWVRAGGALFLLSAIGAYVFARYDPLGGFPDRSVGDAIVFGVVPPLVVGILLLVAGALPRPPREAPLGAWLRNVLSRATV